MKRKFLIVSRVLIQDQDKMSDLRRSCQALEMFAGEDSQLAADAECRAAEVTAQLCGRAAAAYSCPAFYVLALEDSPPAKSTAREVKEREAKLQRAVLAKAERVAELCGVPFQRPTPGDVAPMAAPARA